MNDPLWVELARTAPATAVLALVAWRLDQRLGALSTMIEGLLTRLANSALREP